MRSLFLIAGAVAMIPVAASSASANPWQRHGCPPGLAKKHNGCMPPGQAKKMWNRGQYVPRDWNRWSSYNSIPRRYRDRVPYRRDYRYVYRDNYVYVVDPRTRLIRDVINLLVR